MDNRIYQINGRDCAAMTKELAEKYDLSSAIGDKNAKIALKPNLIVSKTPDSGAVTHTEIVISLIEYLQDNGFKNIKIIESAWVGDSTQRGFRANGYFELSKKYNVPLVDVKADRYEKKSAYGITMEISKEILDTDYLINLPVLKGHCQTLMTCALKNMKGCLSDSSKRLFHSLGLHKPIAVLNSIRKPNLTIVDSMNGDLDFEEGGTPVQTNRMLLAEDPVLLDSYCATLIGYSPEEIGYIKNAAAIGVGSMGLSSAEIVKLNEPLVCDTHASGRARNLERFTCQKSACSACYANLINALARMDENGTLPRNLMVNVGQGFKGCESRGIGSGNCTKGFEVNIPGCPPTAKAIKDVLGSCV